MVEAVVILTNDMWDARVILRRGPQGPIMSQIGQDNPCKSHYCKPWLSFSVAEDQERLPSTNCRIHGGKLSKFGKIQKYLMVTSKIFVEARPAAICDQSSTTGLEDGGRRADNANTPKD
jgi:hypothetical protein